MGQLGSGARGFYISQEGCYQVDAGGHPSTTCWVAERVAGALAGTQRTGLAAGRRKAGALVELQAGPCADYCARGQDTLQAGKKSCEIS
jgi:hypothetical protein